MVDVLGAGFGSSFDMFGYEYFLYTILGSLPSNLFDFNAADERLLLETRVQHSEIYSMFTILVVYLYFESLAHRADLFFMSK